MQVYSEQHYMGHSHLKIKTYWSERNLTAFHLRATQGGLDFLNIENREGP